MWIVYALLAAVAGATVAVLSKAGLKNVDAGVGLAIQSVLILVLSWGAVAVRGNFAALKDIDRPAWVFLTLSGVVTTASSFVLFKALKLGSASRVVPLDRLSLVFGIALAAVFLKERLTGQVVAGAALMTAGAVLITMAKE